MTGPLTRIDYTMSTLITRAATLDDVTWIAEQLRRFAQDYGTRRLLFPDDPAEAQTKITWLVSEHVVFVAEWLGGGRDGERVGFILGLLTPHFFNSAIATLVELFWWVMPDARGTRAATLLLEEFVRAGRERAQWITCGLVTGRTNISAKSLEKRGFHQHEANFLLEVD